MLLPHCQRTTVRPKMLFASVFCHKGLSLCNLSRYLSRQLILHSYSSNLIFFKILGGALFPKSVITHSETAVNGFEHDNLDVVISKCYKCTLSVESKV